MMPFLSPLVLLSAETPTGKFLEWWPVIIFAICQSIAFAIAFAKVQERVVVQEKRITSLEKSCEEMVKAMNRLIPQVEQIGRDIEHEKQVTARDGERYLRDSQDMAVMRNSLLRVEGSMKEIVATQKEQTSSLDRMAGTLEALADRRDL